MTDLKPFKKIGYVFCVLTFASVTRLLVAQNRTSNATAQSNPHVHVIEATYGDKSAGNVCIPNLSICKDSSECSFTVDDSLCDVSAKAKVLEVVWDCGAGTDIKTSTAAKGTKISLVCGN